MSADPRPSGESAVQRYDLVTNYRCGTTIEEMERADDGEWVRWEDVSSRLAAAEQALEQERMRRAGCGVAAMQNTREAYAAGELSHDAYGYSASYSDVRAAVLREIEHREAREQAEAETELAPKAPATAPQV